MRKTRLLIVQPYVPQYRIAFFEQLISKLAAHDVICRVAAASASSLQAQRYDAARAPWWVISTRARHVHTFGMSFGSLGSGRARRSADAIIVGLLGSSADTYGALIQRRTRGVRVGLWGHVRSFAKAAHPLDIALERWQARRADHIFAYTPSGARQALSYGVAADAITTVMNSVDVSSTIRAVHDLSEEDLLGFQCRYNIDPSNTGSLIAGLDAAKRIAFLQRALDVIWREDKAFKLLVGGRGADEHLLRPSVERGQVIMLGYAGPHEKALMARSSRVIAMPGGIGLVAIESLALGLPLVTTNWPFHGPEAEYLDEGTTKFSSVDDPVAYARLLLDITRRRPGSGSKLPFPTLPNMVDNFHEGVSRMLA